MPRHDPKMVQRNISVPVLVERPVQKVDGVGESNEMKVGDPVAGFPRVGDEATEEQDKRWNGTKHTQGRHFIQHKQACITRVIDGVIPSKHSFRDGSRASRK